MWFRYSRKIASGFFSFLVPEFLFQRVDVQRRPGVTDLNEAYGESLKRIFEGTRFEPMLGKRYLS